MDPIVDFSAAPHLPHSLRDKSFAPERPDVALVSFANATLQTGTIAVLERNGELYIEFANAA